MAVPSSGLHSNGYSLIHHILKNKKIKLTKKLKNDLIKPTKIYVNELNKINNNNLINGCAHITGGGLLENLIRIIPDGLSININLSQIKTKPIFKWIKKNNVSDSEMLKTFNCGVGFCLITNKKNKNRIKKKFSKEFQPYEIGSVKKNKKKILTFGRIKW